MCSARLWQAEAVLDKIQLLEGILQFCPAGECEQERALFVEEMDRLKGLVTRHNLPTLDRLPMAASIAQSVGRAEEHKALFKLFSKVVHPSSYLVNDYSNAASRELAIILQTYMQLYAWDTFSRICQALSVPADVRSFSHNGASRGA